MDKDVDTSAATIDGEDDLRARYPSVSPLAQKKVLSRLDKHCRRIVALSPFVCIGTYREDGGCDVSPKGDPPGFVRVLDDTHLAIPDRPGNNLLDSLSNLTHNPAIGLLFLVPGVNETLRVNGTAHISTDPKLLEAMAIRGKAPRAATIVEVREAFLHCAKALVRGKLWSEDYRIARKELPSLGEMLHDQFDTGMSAEAAEDRVQTSLRDNLY